MLQTEKALYVRKDSDDNYPQQSSVSDFIDIYVPIHFDNTVVGVIQVQSVAGAVLGPLSSELNIVIYVLLLSSLLVLSIVGGIFHFFVLTPIKLAGSLARSVSAGNFEGRTIPVYGDEIGDLVEFEYNA